MLDNTSGRIAFVSDVAQAPVSEIKLDGSENKANAGVFRELWEEVKAEKARARAQARAVAGPSRGATNHLGRGAS